MYKARDVARELSANFAMGIPLMRDWRVQQGRTVGASVELKARGILAQFSFFSDTMKYGGLAGKTVVEIGPGDAIPLAPLFIAAGARRYVAIDRFLGDVTSAAALDLYRRVVQLAPPTLADQLRALGLASDNDWRHFLTRSQHVDLVRSGIELDAPAQGRDADYVVSFNVCEHLDDMAAAFKNMKALLAPHGCMIHRVDYGPHDLWQRYDNPLTFLTVPESLWRLSSSNRGCPNRVRHAQLLDIAADLELHWMDRIGTQVDIKHVHTVRSHLAKRFRALSDAELSVLDAEIVLGVRDDLDLGTSFSS